MTRDDIIRMAREAGLWPTEEWSKEYGIPTPNEQWLPELERFARLVIAHERKRLMEDLAPSGSFVSWNNTKCNPLADHMMQSKSAWDDGYASGVAAEREACAHVCLDQANAPPGEGREMALFCAAAIRARGQE
jgi:hypothetical protein